MAKALMIQGTGSGAGKSLIAAAFCRIFSDRGVNVAPFKAQNMALNSCIAACGGEIGRAQGLQAEAARTEPTVDMNPILLKVSGDSGSQVIIHGRVHSHMKAKEYYAFKKDAWEAVKKSYDRLCCRHDLIVIEGAGSPAEINLSAVDIVNMSVAKYAKAPVILVGDIDRGGVFASLFGTVKLLGRDSRHIKAFLINKFRGDKEILDPGLDMIRLKTGKPVIGVLPFISNIGLPEEDGLALQRMKTGYGGHGRDAEKGTVKIVIIRLPYISNFTDFDPFHYEPDVEMVYSLDPAEIENGDLVIIPGSKNTVKDLLFLKERGLDRSVKKAFSRGVQVVGMCGGYQMLGKKILDPDCVESGHNEIRGIGLLQIETVFGKKKTTCRIRAKLGSFESGIEGEKDFELDGYEIHMGESRGDIGLFAVQRLSQNAERSTLSAESFLDGSMNRNCWGTYIHGIFENDFFRRSVINRTRAQMGLPVNGTLTHYSVIKDRSISNLASVVRDNVDMDFLERTIGL